MPHVWYYAQGGTKFGPIVAQELNALASAGKLRPADLVWRDGMPEWVSASKVKGLFPAPGAVAVPPPLPQPSAPPSQPADAPMPTVAPPLWNPRAAQACSLLLSWAFGAFLLARNWRALGDANRARRCMIWFYAIFPWLLLALITPDTPAMTGCFRYGSLIAFVVWSVVEAQPQIKRVKDAFGNQYPRKQWPKPLGIGAACLAGFLLVAMIGHSGVGTIRFAEDVDPKTLKTTKEGTSFSTGWVYIVVRSDRPFGDARLIVYGRVAGHEAWHVLGEVTVDPGWDTLTKRELLDEPGTYEIKVTTSKGTLIAQSTVQVVAR